MSNGCPVAILIHSLEIQPIRPVAVSLYTHSGITVPEIIKLISPVPISIHAPSGSINIVILT